MSFCVGEGENKLKKKAGREALRRTLIGWQDLQYSRLITLFKEDEDNETSIMIKQLL